MGHWALRRRPPRMVPTEPTGAAVLAWLGSRAILAGWPNGPDDRPGNRGLRRPRWARGGGRHRRSPGGAQRHSIRACDAQLNADFRHFHAGVHPANRSNLGRYGGLRGEAIVALLGEEGIPLAIPTSARGLAAACFECYPLAALASLFHLRRVLQYKALGLRRSPEVRRAAYRRLGQPLRSLRDAEPGLDLPRGLVGKPLEGLGGRGSRPMRTSWMPSFAATRPCTLGSGVHVATASLAACWGQILVPHPPLPGD